MRSPSNSRSIYLFTREEAKSLCRLMPSQMDPAVWSEVLASSSSHGLKDQKQRDMRSTHIQTMPNARFEDRRGLIVSKRVRRFSNIRYLLHQQLQTLPRIVLNIVMLCYISNISKSGHPSIDIESTQGFYDLPQNPCPAGSSACGLACPASAKSTSWRRGAGCHISISSATYGHHLPRSWFHKFPKAT